MNPEFARLARRELTPLRRVGAPLLILLALPYFGASRWGFDADPDRALLSLAQGAFALTLFIVAFWGSRVAADAVAGEMRGRTWDTQRLSGLGPTQMTIGKLFGAPLGAWYAIAFLLGTQIVILQFLSDGAHDRSLLLFRYAFGPVSILTQALGAFAVFAAALFASMAALADQENPRSFDTTLFQLAAVSGGVLLTMANAEIGHSSSTRFFGAEMYDSAALAVFFAFFGFWAALGVWVRTRKAFGVDISATPWIAFLVALGAYLFGWDNWQSEFLPFFGFALAAYGAALIEPHRRIAWIGFTQDIGGGRWRALLRAPAWIYAMIALLVATVIQYPAFVERNGVLTDLTDRFDADLAPFAMVVFILRDMLVCVWAGFRTRDGRGLWTALLILAALWVLLPAMAGGPGGTAGAALFLPYNAASLISAVVQAIGAAIAVSSALRRPKTRNA